MVFTEASESLFKGIDEVEKRKMVKEVILSLVREDDLKGINELEGFLQSAAKGYFNYKKYLFIKLVSEYFAMHNVSPSLIVRT